MKLLVILFIVKLFTQTNIFKSIEKKHGQFIRKQVKNLELLLTRIMKIKTDIAFMKSCKREELIPTFCNVNLSK